MRVTPGGVLLGLAAIMFLVAALFLVAVLTYSCCGVSYFSPQVSLDYRLGMLIIPAIPAAMALVLLAGGWAWRKP